MSSNDKAQSKIGSMAQAAMSEGDKSTADRRRVSHTVLNALQLPAKLTSSHPLASTPPSLTPSVDPLMRLANFANSP